ncbi:MAG: phage tail tube protein, partial [Lachnospiraceae bacterium]|nr:phage tail tube protein [Lachnospiraceae bacterium]
DVYFDIQVVNEDPGSKAGRQEVILKDCNMDGGILTKFDADGEYLDEEMNFTFEDVMMPSAFTDLPGFVAG